MEYDEAYRRDHDSRRHAGACEHRKCQGPFDIEVSGRGLDEPVSIAGPFEYDQLYPPIGVTSVDVGTLEGEDPYLVSIVVDDQETGAPVTVFYSSTTPPATTTQLPCTTPTAISYRASRPGR